MSSADSKGLEAEGHRIQRLAKGPPRYEDMPKDIIAQMAGILALASVRTTGAATSNKAQYPCHNRSGRLRGGSMRFGETPNSQIPTLQM